MTWHMVDMGKIGMSPIILNFLAWRTGRLEVF